VGSTPRVLGIIAATALAGGLAACGSPSPSAHRAAASPPGATAGPVRVQANAAGWSGMVQRPAVIYVGMGGAPVARRLVWRHWGSPQAWASGTLDIYRAQPGPISGWRPATYPVTVRLQDIGARGGQRFYRRMVYAYVNRRGVTLSLRFQFSEQSGGSVPSWNPPRRGTA
jgi:hypothetical protein